MELWIPITIFAAFVQNIRSALQKHLKGKLSTSGATFTRFAFGAPIALAYVFGLLAFGGYSLPVATDRFIVFAIIGGLGQIGATALLVYLFSFRNFAVGTAFSKTEIVQITIFGIIVLGEGVSAGALLGIAISLAGVIMLAVNRPKGGVRAILAQCFEKPALIGIASGALFGIAAIAVRAAALSLEGGDFIIRAAFALACVTTFQTIVTTLYLRWREPGQITAVFRQWKLAGLVGITSILGSAGWFTAMTLQNAAYVRALGQIELVFTFIVAYVFFKERASLHETAAIILIIAGILLLVLLR